MGLEEYRDKRRFAKTPEPAGASAPSDDGQWRFVVQKHDATNLHYDLRLELDGVLLSWAIPKGPSLDPAQKRLAIHVEDHPIDYLEFEGVIPQGEYGGGTVMVWDIGHWTPRVAARADYEKGELKFDLSGEKLRGGFMLIRSKGAAGSKSNQWLLIKEKDDATRRTREYEVLAAAANSVLTGRTMLEIARDRELWLPRSTANSSTEESDQRDLEGASSTHRSLDATPAFSSAFSPTNYPDAKPAAQLPTTVRPCLPTVSRNAPTGAKWIHEIKYDGYRMLCFVERQTAKFISRNGRDWTNKLPTLSKSVAESPIRNAVLDGEVVRMSEDGTTSFQGLQNRIGAGRDGELVYYVFDMLHLDGFDLRPLPLIQRKQVLFDFVHACGANNRLIYSEHLVGDGPTIFRQACKLGVEGIVSKRIDRRYSQGRSESWLKTKCLQSREFVIGGFTPPTASRKGLGAILLGAFDDSDQLQFVGKVGTGFTFATLESLRGQLDESRISKSPFSNLDRRTADKGTVWVKPELIAEIEFGGWTADGIIRFGAFRGLRDDVAREDIDCTIPSASDRTIVAQENTEEITVNPALIDLPPELATLKLTSPDRVVYPETGVTKLGLATYYAQVSRWMLPHMIGRPVSLLRCPGGTNEPCFFQKRPPTGLHHAVEQIMLPTSEGESMYLVVHDIVGLLALVQFGVLEFHLSGARADRHDRPDRIVVDLDPDEGLPFGHTTRAAIEIRDWFSEVGLASFVKTTGGKGLHVVVPIRRRHNWADVKRFSRKVASLFEGRFPQRFTTNPSKAARHGKILIDVMRNTRGATAVAAYSTRAKPKASVSVPIAWDELDIIASSDSMSLQAVIRRLGQSLEDPWAGMFEVDQGLTKKATKFD